MLSFSFVHCTFDWPATSSTLEVSGTEPAFDSLDKLNTTPVGHSTLMQGPDGAPWVAFCEFWSGTSSARNCKRMRLLRLDGKPGDQTVAGDDFVIRYRMLYVGKTDMTKMMRTLTLHRPGDAVTDDASFTFPAGRSILYINSGGNDDVFVYWVLASTTTSWGVFRRDQRYQLSLPVPMGVDPSKPQAQTAFDFLLTSDGNTLVVRTPDGLLMAWSTTDGSSTHLGTRPPDWTLDDPRHAVLTLGADGLRSIPLDGSPETQLSAATIDVTTFAIEGASAFWADAQGLWRVPLDGSAPAMLAVPGAARALPLGPDGTLPYSHDPTMRYIGDAGDGWIGDWQFMQRGRLLTWSASGKRLRFLEHAATLGTVGELTSVDAPGGASRSLGINVHSFAEASDGRVLAIENHVQAGSWNRLVVIDEDAWTKHWVVPSATEFFLVPGRDEVIADVISGASGYDVYRAAIPPR